MGFLDEVNSMMGGKKKTEDYSNVKLGSTKGVPGGIPAAQKAVEAEFIPEVTKEEEPVIFGRTKREKKEEGPNQNVPWNAGFGGDIETKFVKKGYDESRNEWEAALKGESKSGGVTSITSRKRTDKDDLENLRDMNAPNVKEGIDYGQADMQREKEMGWNEYSKKLKELKRDSGETRRMQASDYAVVGLTPPEKLPSQIESLERVDSGKSLMSETEQGVVKALARKRYMEEAEKTEMEREKKENAPKGLAALNPLAGVTSARGWLATQKLEFDAAALGGIPQGKMVIKTDKKGTPVMDNQGKIMYEWQPGMIQLPTYNKKSGWSTTQVEATPANIRQAVILNKQRDLSLKAQEAQVEQVKANTAALKSQTGQREYYLNERQQAWQRGSGSQLPARSESYNIRTGFTPNFNVPGTGESKYIRDRYRLGESPTIAKALSRGRSGLSDMTSRVLSPISAPITPNAKIRMELPNVFGAGTSLSPANANVMAILSPTTQASGGAILSKLSPKMGISGVGNGTPMSYGAGLTPQAAKFGNISFQGMREAGSRVIGGKGKK
jgi:hypothetical protein